MEKIVSLKPLQDAKWLDAQRLKFDPQQLFSIDCSDITRAQGSAANGDSKDPVHFGHAAFEQVKRLCDAFCFDRMPATWGEFKGTYDYCFMLQGMLLGSRTGPWADDVRRLGLQTVQRYFPKDYAAAEAFFDEDRARLRAIHNTDETMTRLGVEFREFSPSD